MIVVVPSTSQEGYKRTGKKRELAPRKLVKDSMTNTKGI